MSLVIRGKTSNSKAMHTKHEKTEKHIDYECIKAGDRQRCRCQSGPVTENHKVGNFLIPLALGELNPGEFYLNFEHLIII